MNCLNTMDILSNRNYSPKFFLQQCPQGQVQDSESHSGPPGSGIVFPFSYQENNSEADGRNSNSNAGHARWCTALYVIQRYFQRATEGGKGQQESFLPVNVGSVGEFLRCGEKSSDATLGCCLAYRRHQSQFVAPTGHPELEFWAGWLHGEAATPSGHWDLLQVFKASQLNLVLQTGLPSYSSRKQN